MPMIEFLTKDFTLEVSCNDDSIIAENFCKVLMDYVDSAVVHKHGVELRVTKPERLENIHHIPILHSKFNIRLITNNSSYEYYGIKMYRASIKMGIGFTILFDDDRPIKEICDNNEEELQHE